MPNGQFLRQLPEVPQLAAGVASAHILLLDNVQANDVGKWVPWSPFSKGSFEIEAVGGSMSATIAMRLSNAATMPGNGSTVTVGGSATTGDVLTISLESPDFPNFNISASYTVVADDTLDTIATNLAAALLVALNTVKAQEFANGDPAQDSYQQAWSAASIQVTVSSAVISIFNQIPNFPDVAVLTAVNSGATETLTVAQYDDGSGFDILTETSPGNTAFINAAAWVKAHCTNYSSGQLSALLVGAIP